MKPITKGYIAANIMIRNELFNNFESFSEAFNKGEDNFKLYICNIWNGITKKIINSDYDLIDENDISSKEDFNIKYSQIGGINIFGIIFPERNIINGQAKCAAITVLDRTPKYFTMEFTENGQYSVGEWRLEENKFAHYNYGIMQGSTFENFIQSVLSIINYQNSKKIKSLKSETIKLINTQTVSFRDLFSICVGKTYSNQIRFVNYLGSYNSWSTDVTKGYLKLDERMFDVEYIGTTSPESDDFWYSADAEEVIPDKYVNLILRTKKIMQNLGLGKYTESKIQLEGNVNEYNLSMMYIAFAPEEVTYFCGNGNTRINMFVKNLPNEIFEKIGSNEFVSRVTDIISTFDVNAKLMIKAFLIENYCDYTEIDNEIIADFSDKSKIKFKFNGDVLQGFEGVIS